MVFDDVLDAAARSLAKGEKAGRVLAQGSSDSQTLTFLRDRFCPAADRLFSLLCPMLPSPALSLSSSSSRFLSSALLNLCRLLNTGSTAVEVGGGFVSGQHSECPVRADPCQA
eukprot:762972-Hanusia_phi.AAC.9